MMNASFRTAFWAMCLGLTVPMMLFVGVELTSGGRTSANRKLATVISPGSLEKQWKTGEAEGGAPRPGAKATKAPRRADVAAVRLDPRLEPETALAADATNQGAILDPRIEPDPSLPEESAPARPRFPALPTAARPRVEIVPGDDAGGRPVTEKRIEAQLDGILGHLDRLVTVLGDRKSMPDPMQQATELLLRLQEARRVQGLAAQVPELAAPAAPPTAASPTAASPPVASPTAGPSANDVPPPPAPPPSQTQPSPERATRPAVREAPPPAAQTRIYRPRYIDVRALEKLATPLLTPGSGRIGAASGDGEDALGDQPSHLPTQWDALVVRDTPDVLRKIDLLLQELDVPPAQILVEATLLTVRLDPARPFGVDLAEFNTGRAFSVQPADLAGGVVWSTGRGQPNLPVFSPTKLTHGTGVKCGILRGDARAFLQAVQAAYPVRGAAASQTTIVNKQSAELLLSEGAAAPGEGARANAPGTILRLRPIATRDGLVHLEIRPIPAAELGSWNDSGALRPGTLANRVTLRPGETAVVGGFIADHVELYNFKKPGAGETPLTSGAPGVEPGAESRTETIVLLTPHLARSTPRPTPQELPGEPAATRQAAKRLPASLARTPKSPGAGEPAVRSTGTDQRKKPAIIRPDSPRPDSPKKKRAPRPPSDGSAAADDQPPRLILQASGENLRRAVRTKTPKPIARKAPAPADLPEDQPAGSLEEIPEIPADVDGTERPVIRPANRPRGHGR
jgi:hypothetical protein